MLSYFKKMFTNILNIFITSNEYYEYNSNEYMV